MVLLLSVFVGHGVGRRQGRCPSPAFSHWRRAAPSRSPRASPVQPKASSDDARARDRKPHRNPKTRIWPADLENPNRRRIANAQIPSRMQWNARIVSHTANAASSIGFRNLLAAVRPQYRGIKRAGPMAGNQVPKSPRHSRNSAGTNCALWLKGMMQRASEKAVPTGPHRQLRQKDILSPKGGRRRGDPFMPDEHRVLALSPPLARSAPVKAAARFDTIPRVAGPARLFL